MKIWDIDWGEETMDQQLMPTQTRVHDPDLDGILARLCQKISHKL